MVSYNVNFFEQKINISNNLTKVKHLANGFMMIQRNVLETMFDKYKDTKYTDDIGYLNKNENKFAYALFDCGVIDDHYLSEDWMFCHRWSLLNNDIYIDISISLGHTGMVDFKGCLLSTFI